jgi:hypothetical protein
VHGFVYSEDESDDFKQPVKHDKPTPQQPVVPNSLTDDDRREAAGMWVEQQIKHIMSLPDYIAFEGYTLEMYNPKTKNGKHFLALTKYPELKDLIDAKLQEKQDEFKQQGRV